MRLEVIALLVVCLLYVPDISGQTVDEAASTVRFTEGSLVASFVIRNKEATRGAVLSVEVIDGDGTSIGRAKRNLRLRRGTRSYAVRIPLKLRESDSPADLPWYRLRYRVGAAYGTVSLSEIIKDVFDLRVAAGSTIKSGQTYRARVRTLDPFRKTAVRDVEISGTLELDIDTGTRADTLTIKARSKTDKNGFAVLDFPIPAGTQLEYDGELKITATKNGLVREVEVSPDVIEGSGSVFLTIDKPIYQPGQAFRVRALLFDNSRFVIAGSELEFTIKDEEGTLLYRETVDTSAYGVASVSWNIPENAKLGEYHVEVEADGDDEIYGNRQAFKVTRYDLPKFAVKAKPDKTFYLPSEKEAAIKISADYIFGKPVRKGKVRVVQESKRRWNWWAQKYDVEEKDSVEGETDEAGTFVARFDLADEHVQLASRGWLRFEDIHLAAYFTDASTNRTEQRRFDIRLSKQPIHVYYLTNSYYNNPALPVNAFVSTFYADGSPAECEVVVEGRRDNDKSSGYRQLRELRTNSYGAGRLSFMRPVFKSAEDDLDLIITAVDKKGRKGTYQEEVYFNKNDRISVRTDKAIYARGEEMKIDIRSTRKSSLVYVDIINSDWTTVSSHYVFLKNGEASLRIPSGESYSGKLVLSAYSEIMDEDGDLDLVRTTAAVIFPEQQNLLVRTDFGRESFRPGEQAGVRFAVANGSGDPVQSALGVVVFDKAVEERARTDSEFGNYFGRFFGWLGYETRFGDVILKDLNELDLSKPVPEGLQLVAEAMFLSTAYYYPEIERAEFDTTRPRTLYKPYFRTQFHPIEKALRRQYETDYAHPTDDESLDRILLRAGIDRSSLVDPWGNQYKASYEISKANDFLTFSTAGADKKFGTADDFTVSTSKFKYFTPVGLAVDKAVREYKLTRGTYVRDYATLKDAVARHGVDLDSLRDRWGREYVITFEVARRSYLIRFTSLGADGVLNPRTWRSDDFEPWKTYTDYFADTELKINRILAEKVNSGIASFPASVTEFNELLVASGMSVEDLRDGFGNRVYIVAEKKTRYSDKLTVIGGKRSIEPVTQVVAYIRIRSAGRDGVRGAEYYRSDDFTLATFSSVITERFRDIFNRSKVTIKNIAFTGTAGAISGIVTDATGAVMPGVLVTATLRNSERSYSDTTGDDGGFLIGNLPSGSYTVKSEALGFQTASFSDVRVRSQSITTIEIAMEPGTVSAVVTVSGEAGAVLNSSATRIRTVAKANGSPRTAPGAISTPRLREYFPETLVWQPELITDKEGKAELKFRMADNITTWKLYAVASTKNGKIGVSEKEVRAFQPFFVDLEPPKFLTEGDEIYLPAQVRNYTDRQQAVNVSMSKSDWFSFLGASDRKVQVGPNSSENAVFGFRADRYVDKGSQRVTAVAEKESDAIEKPVTVRPNGQEIVATESRIFRGTTSFEADFPGDALPDTRNVRLKIYPNLLSHVADSVEGLLQRPYGCGEQTISSTYPNLMILKFANQKNKLRRTAFKYLRKGYERLLGYQTAGGGFSYWGARDEPNIALTAYAIRFLKDAGTVIEVDSDVITKAERWLISRQRTDGSWTKRYSWESAEKRKRTKLITSYVARALAMRFDDKKPAARATPLTKALDYLKARNAEIDEPYALALFGLASLDAGRIGDAERTAGLLASMSIAEGNSAYWKLETNTPFYGWGTAGRVETTALVVQLLTRAGKNKAENATGPTRDLISKGMMFLLKNKDRYGVWHSTQTTVNVLDAFLAGLEPDTRQARPGADVPRTATISVNGSEAKRLELPPVKELAAPIELSLDGFLSPSANKIGVAASDGGELMAQIVSTHYLDWQTALTRKSAGDASASEMNGSRTLELDYSCDRNRAAVMEPITCSVRAERVGFRGYGMLLAEIGTPPGANVSRESLEKAISENWSLSRYDVLPDRVVFYMWARPGGTKFSFSFKPRYAINAQTPASLVYDYYNDEARATVAPLRFEVK